MTMEDKHGFLKDVTAWNNHRPLLLIALEATGGNVLELGMGDGSTMYLHEYCVDKHRLLVSFDNNKEWVDKFKAHDCPWHIIDHNDNFDTLPIEKYVWDVALVDHAPGERRHIDIKRLKDCCKIIVIHDSEVSNGGYMLDKIWHLFKYAIHITTGNTRATAVSNTIDLTQYENSEILQAFK